MKRIFALLFLAVATQGSLLAVEQNSNSEKFWPEKKATSGKNTKFWPEKKSTSGKNY